MLLSVTSDEKDVATCASLVTLSESTFWSGINWESLARFVLFPNTRLLSLSQLQFFSQEGIPPYHAPYFAFLENPAEIGGFVTMKPVSE